MTKVYTENLKCLSGFKTAVDALQNNINFPKNLWVSMGLEEPIKTQVWELAKMQVLGKCK